MNELFVILDIVVTFTLVFFTHRFFGKEGLIAWVGIATILANIMTAKTIEAFGLTFTIGNALFASTFLATDILTECYGKNDALKAVFTGFFGSIVFIISSQIALLYAPSNVDYAHGAMKDLFSLSVRISVSSLIMYLMFSSVLKRKCGWNWLSRRRMSAMAVARAACSCTARARASPSRRALCQRSGRKINRTTKKLPMPIA